MSVIGSSRVCVCDVNVISVVLTTIYIFSKRNRVLAIVCLFSKNILFYIFDFNRSSEIELFFLSTDIMTTLFTEDFDKICRCCLCKNGEMRPLFGSCLDNMLRFVAEIEVNFETKSFRIFHAEISLSSLSNDFVIFAGTRR